jgi:hypothetical protein
LKYIYVKPEEWNKTLTSYTKGGRARYWQCTPKEKAIALRDYCCQGFERRVTIPYADEEYIKKVNAYTFLFTVTLDSVKHKATIKEAVIEPDGELYSDSYLQNDLHEARILPVKGIEFAKEDIFWWHMSFESKLTPITKESKEAVTAESPHEDMFGVKIEVGDVIAYPCEYCGINSTGVHRIEVEDITGQRIAGKWSPKHVIVIRAANPDKKLGW